MNNGGVDLRIAHFTDNRVADPRGKVAMPSREFHQARNSILEVCRKFGSVGPMADFPLAPNLTEKEADSQWKSTGVERPDFFILDDQLNHERYVYVEIHNGRLLSIEWVSAIAECLKSLSGWGVGIDNIKQGYILIFGDLLLVKGPTFDPCKDLESVVNAGRKNIH